MKIFRVSVNTERLTNLWIIVSDEVRVVFLNAIVENGDDDALASDPHLPRLLHAHVEPATSVQVPAVRLEEFSAKRRITRVEEYEPHERELGILDVDQVVEDSVGVDDVQLVLGES